MYQHILIPIDGSERSAKAARLGLEFTRAHDARATVLYVLADSGVAAGLGKSMRDEAGRGGMAQSFLAPLADQARELGVTAECFYVEGSSPATEIVRIARERQCDLIHMSTHGRSGVADLLLGSVTHDVLKLCTLPVLVVR